VNMDRYDVPAQLPFGAWLRTKKNDEGLLGQVASGGAADRRFPRSGDPEAVRKHLSQMQADGDMFAAVDDAATDGMSGHG
jgi:hypothetical protein